MASRMITIFSITKINILVLPDGHYSLFCSHHHRAEAGLQLDRMCAGVSLEVPKLDGAVVGAADHYFFGKLDQFGDMRGVLVR